MENIKVKNNINLLNYTTIKIGGCTEFFAEPKNISEFIEFLNWAKLNKNVDYIPTNYEVAKKFLEITNKGDLILNMGAGDCHDLWSLLHSR